MPVLEFELTEPPDVITNYVWGVMMFPTDSNRAFEYFVRAQLAGRNIHAAPNTEEITLPVSWVKALVAGDSLEATGKKTIKARREGATAGILLLSAYLYSQTGQPLTLNGAIEAMEIASEKNAFPKEWLAPYMNRGEIHRSWKHMRPVAHLWAALCNFESGIKLKSVEAGPAALIGVLRLAAAYLDWGATQKVPGINGTGRIRPLIDKEKAWNLPPSVATLPLPALAPDMLPDAVKSAAFGKRGAR